MSALTLQVASDLIAAHIGFVTGSIDREPAMPFRPLAKLPNPQRTDAQPSRAVSPNPATFDPDPPTPEEVAEAYRFRYGETA